MSEDVLYKKSYFNRIGELEKLAPEAFKAFINFDQKALAPGALSGKIKELIAVAVAHTTGCPYCIEVHIENVKKQEASKEEVTEAIMVATALKAGSAIAHGVNALNSYDGEGQDELYKGAYFKRMREFSELNGDMFKSFISFDQEAMKPGLLTSKEKELVAVAVAHTTGCPYCIEVHTKGAQKEGASLEEIAESVFVSTALKAGSAIAHSVNALNAYERNSL
ncbi:carboxymuconolactone decarboxylase family protein [Alteribacter populi]|uniref:carboxymuconolactone decarboxylase family protein n=1 Tax=Alteribacter populi TaxID=2011011 RepID=UPI000BBA8D2F|nr:carboxymuconolactone decarboxylase family protein [Alteribacter populi]